LNSGFEAVEGKLAYEILHDACVAELVEKFKLVEAASNTLLEICRLQGG
jgi:hypothetical protein